MAKMYIVESADTTRALEAKVMSYFERGFELAGGVSYNYLEKEFIQALYHSNFTEGDLDEEQGYQQGDMYA